MTQINWEELESLVRSMTSSEKARLLSLLGAEPKQEKLARDPLLGVFSDAPELMDKIVQDAYFARENQPLRLPPEE